MFCLIIKSQYFIIIFFGSENLMWSPFFKKKCEKCYFLFSGSKVKETVLMYCEKKMFREYRTYEGCMEDVREFQFFIYLFFFALIFPES